MAEPCGYAVSRHLRHAVPYRVKLTVIPARSAPMGDDGRR
jgi:hypothetical protein